jgi:ABC-type sugar transport system, ATPase component
MEKVSKSFSGLKVLNHVNLNVKKGEVHVLIGENGAGKSTLMKILIGMHQKDEGKIYYKDKEVEINSTREALDMGITMIHQELSPILEMTVAENVFLGREILNPITKFVDVKELNKKTKELFESLDITDILPHVKMKTLSIAQTQMVEIAKAVSYKADLIIMDEPTSAITDSEVEKLFTIINSLRDNGVAIIYISHKLDEIYRISDMITVLRDGEYIATKETSLLPKEELVRLMVGRELKDMFQKSEHEIGDVVLEVRNFSNGKFFRDVNFKLNKGEILGVAGLMGAGRTEIVETIFGMRGKYEGEIYKDGKLVNIRNERDAMKCGIALATEDRKQTGLFLGLSIKRNISISWLDNLSKFSFVKTKDEDSKINHLINMLKIKASNSNVLANTLSGGNQQKVVLAKWLLTNPDILILDEPTRGIDIGAKTEIYKIMESLAREGKSIIMVSSEMPELLGVSDRIIVIADGAMKGELCGEGACQEMIMCKISGV